MTKRKIMVLCFMLLLLPTIGYGEGTGMEVDEHDEYSYERTQALVDILHAHSNLSLKLLSKPSIPESENNEYGLGQAHEARPPRVIRSENHEMRGYYFRYPHNTEQYRLTQLALSRGDTYHVFGVYVGDSLEKARDAMAQYGYASNGITYVFYSRNSIHVEEFAAGKIIIRFIATERDMKIYQIFIYIYEKDMMENEHNTALYAQTQDLVDILHAHSDLGMELLSKSRIPESEIIQYVPGQGHAAWPPPDSTLSENNEVRGYYFRYPYYAREYRLTHVSWDRGETHHVFGIHIGDSVEEAREILAQYGYTSYESPYSLHHERGIIYEQFANGKVIISFEANEADMLIRRIAIGIPEPDPHLPEGVRW